MEPSSFFGHWDAYSGPMHVEIVLHEDGTYGEAAWGGLQTHWGKWSLENQGGSDFLALQPLGSNPPDLMSLYGAFAPAEMHMIASVQPNQIQLFDGLMVRRYVPAALPNQAASPPAPAGFFGTPVAPPSPLFSAPAPPPPPQGQSTPILNQWKNMDPATATAINNIYAQMNADDLKTSSGILANNAVEYQSEFTANKGIIDAGNAASHAFAEKFSATLNPKRF